MMAGYLHPVLPQRGAAQQYEFLLYGSVSESSLSDLLHRLRGLCDQTITSVGGFRFCDREITYKIGTLARLFVACVCV